MRLAILSNQSHYSAFNDFPLQFYPDAYNNRKGSMASFAFRLLIAKLPSYLGSHKVALDRLTDMLLVAKEIKESYAAESNEKAETFWSKREQTILHSLINCALAVRPISRKKNLLISYLQKKTRMND